MRRLRAARLNGTYERFLALAVDPELNRGPLPLMPGVVGQPLWHRVAVENEPVEHQGKVGIGDAPFAKQLSGVGGQ